MVNSRIQQRVVIVGAGFAGFASAVTRGYHLSAMSGNRARVLTDWVLNAATPPETTSFGVITAESVPLDVDRPRA